MSLATLKYLLIAVALAYLILPRDLIPDAAGLIGRIDDAIVIAYLIRFYRVRKLAKKTQAENSRDGEKRQSEFNRDQTSQGTHDTESAKPDQDPYSVLGVARSATATEVTAAYKKEAAKYHPDKVSHLGEELQKLAHERMLAIRKAYDELRG